MVLVRVRLVQAPHTARDHHDTVVPAPSQLRARS
eukprot:COSAG05_NODE_9801_length_600_cov_1.395210_1_plen_33_part_10